MAAETFAEFVDRYGRPHGSYPVIDLDAVDQQRQTVIVSFAGGTKKAIVQFMGLAAGTSNEHLCLDVHAFVDEVVARSSVFGLEDGARYEGFTDDAPGRSHGWPAVRGVTVLIGAQTPATVPGWYQQRVRPGRAGGVGDHRGRGRRFRNGGAQPPAAGPGDAGLPAAGRCAR